jgi:hypothetical protein
MSREGAQPAHPLGTHAATMRQHPPYLFISLLIPHRRPTWLELRTDCLVGSYSHTGNRKGGDTARQPARHVVSCKGIYNGCHPTAVDHREDWELHTRSHLELAAGGVVGCSHNSNLIMVSIHSKWCHSDDHGTCLGVRADDEEQTSDAKPRHRIRNHLVRHARPPLAIRPTRRPGLTTVVMYSKWERGDRVTGVMIVGPASVWAPMMRSRAATPNHETEYAR